MLVHHKASDDPTVDTTHGGGLTEKADRIALRLGDRLGRQYAWMASTRRVLSHPWVQDTDVIQLFNTHTGTLATPTIAKLARIKPVVWRLSDMWLATGHCAYAGDCPGWRTGCSPCPDLNSYPAIGIDRAGQLWEQKRRLFASSRITLVAPSSWAEEIVRTSPLTAHLPVRRIPNGIDLSRFSPGDKAQARASLGIPHAGPLILFSAQVADDNPRKGSELLKKALHGLGPAPGTGVLVVGHGGEKWQGQIPLPVFATGYLNDPALILAANRAADIMVAPSAVENLPNTVIEAMATSLPIVAFNAGGMKDAVIAGQTGLLAPVGDAEALAQALASLLGDAQSRRRMGDNARLHALAEFDMAVEAERFIALYKELTAS
jgi:glycosyltransferase involved in cell wall biosynthesis